MPITTVSIVALVAGSSVLAAFVNQGLTVVRERWIAKRDAAFSALYLAIALEAYASDCAAKIAESENYENSAGNAGSPQGNIGELPDYPASMEWKPFGIKSTTHAMSFRIEVETARTMIRDSWEFGDDDDVVPLVREEAARLGTKALGVAGALRTAWKIDPVDYSGEWNARTFLDERHAKYQRERQAREERNRQWNAELFAELDKPQEDEEQTTACDPAEAEGQQAVSEKA